MEDDIVKILDEDFILDRLNELRRWQEKQRIMLGEKQLDQQNILRFEKQKLYELFSLTGLPMDTSSENKQGGGSIFNHESVTPNKKKHKCNRKYYDITEYDAKELRLQQPSMQTFGNKLQSDDQKRDDSQNGDIPKRSFLKRGEGLKKRFKISPDAFRLNNLPKYKFAKEHTKHAQLNQRLDKKCHRQENINDANTIFKVDVTNEVISPEGCPTNVINDRKQRCELELTKRNLKSKTKNYKQDENSSNKFTSIYREVNCYSNEYQNEDSLDNSTLSNHIGLTGFQPHLSTPMAKYLLDTPTRNQVQLQQNELNDLKYFEHLERNINQDSNMEGEENDNSVVLQFKVGLSLSPKQNEKEITENVVENGVENGVEKQNKFASSNAYRFCGDSKHVRFTPSAVRIKNERRQPMEDIYVCTSNEKSMESFQRFKEKLFDRKLKREFQNQLSLAKDFEISDMNSNSSKCGDIDEESQHIFACLSTENEQSLNADKDELFQERLQELDKEIQSFREQNVELTGLIREHELIRLTFDQEKREANECLEKERINFNMYMHDERLKLLNERTESERRMKDLQKLNRSEKDEVIRLREKCSAHTLELSSQEQKHIAAQGRVRSQLKNMEKEVKELRLEVENLRRDNKKLEKENARLRRESNTKILYEINKSISKLPKAKENKGSDIENEKDEKSVCITSGMEKCFNKNAHKTVVAKVTTHREPLGETRLRSKSVPNLRETTEKYSYETILPDAENSQRSPNEVSSTSSYFANDTEGLKYSNIKSRVQSDVTNERVYEKSTKRVIENSDGSKDIWYSNGNLKKVSSDGMCIRMLYFNKDIKETNLKEGTVKYYYSETNTWQTTYLDGLEIFEYPNGQTEHRFKNGVIEIHFPNGSARITNPERERNEGIKEEWRYADGTNVIQLTNNDQIIILPNGQREVHTYGHKRREYPDGTVKIVYPDGSQETRYSNGRVRLKNKDGKLIMDSETISI